MKLLSAAVLALVAAPGLASAATTLDFEDVIGYASVADQYAVSHGVTFGGDILGFTNEYEPNFSNAPSPVGIISVVGEEATMNVAGGFRGEFSFWYSASESFVGGVQVWSGLDGTGDLLASFDLTANAQDGGCSDTAFCNFDKLAVALSGDAHSVTFGNSLYYAGFDNITITAVPEPTSALLMALGAAGLAASRRRRA